MKTPISYYGGKYHMRKQIVDLFPPHHTYVEVFGGGGSVLFHKALSPVEVYNDIDGDLVNLFRVMRDYPAEFHAKMALTPYSREEFYNCRGTFTEGDCVERARKYFVKLRQSYAGKGSSWSMSVGLSRRNMAATTSKYLSAIDRLADTCDRLKTVQIENSDFKRLIKQYDTTETLFYLDPPYMFDTRRATDCYVNEMSDADHLIMLDMLAEIKGKFVLSGYENVIYCMAARKNKWGFKTLEKTCHAVKSSGEGGLSEQKRIEYLWYKK